MSQNTVQARYDDLAALAARFRGQAEYCANTQRAFRRAFRLLQNDGWKGRGAETFFSEMQSIVFPAMARLGEALTTGDEVLRQIIDIMRTAEHEAAQPFRAAAASNSATFSAATPAGTLASGAAGDTTEHGGSGPITSGSFTLGAPKRPAGIFHDNGFLDAYSPTAPTMQDYAQLAEWRAFLEASKLATKAGAIDLDDANDAYEHFLDGQGAGRSIALEEYYAEDPSGRQNLEVALRDAMLAAEELGRDRQQFQMTSNRAFAVGTIDLSHPDIHRLNYPRTENWQKTIGAHLFWTSGDVRVTTNPDQTRHFRMELTVHVEDRYNFKPESSDISTGIPDSANGRFELTGLAQQYMNYGQTTRVVEWDQGRLPPSAAQDSPSENRGARPGANTRDRPRPRPDGFRGDQDRIRPPVNNAGDQLRDKARDAAF